MKQAASALRGCHGEGVLALRLLGGHGGGDWGHDVASVAEKRTAV